MMRVNIAVHSDIDSAMIFASVPETVVGPKSSKREAACVLPAASAKIRSGNIFRVFTVKRFINKGLLVVVVWSFPCPLLVSAYRQIKTVPQGKKAVIIAFI
jgi:hypothetical protein